MEYARSQLLGFELDAINMDQAVAQVLRWCSEPRPDRCRYVVTPNVDHAVLFRQHGLFRDAYRDADLVLADGYPIVWASRLLGQPVPGRVAGSDLIPAILAAADPNRPLRVFLLGAADGVADRAARHVTAACPGVIITGTWSPPPGFENDPAECDRILERIAAARPQLLVVGLGAPKQECWVHRHRERIQAAVALCVGATIDFLAGEQRRAPQWMQRAGIEWLHRMGSDPRRLVRRYARDAWVFPQLVMAQWVANRADRNRQPTPR